MSDKKEPELSHEEAQEIAKKIFEDAGYELANDGWPANPPHPSDPIYKKMPKQFQMGYSGGKK